MWQIILGRGGARVAGLVSALSGEPCPDATGLVLSMGANPPINCGRGENSVENYQTPYLAFFADLSAICCGNRRPRATFCERENRPMSDIAETIHPLPGLLTSSRGYKPFRYPWAYDFWKRQQQVHWMPEEVPLGEDCKDWANNITEAERNLLTQIFRFFTQGDIEVNDNYMEHYARVFKPVEVKMMLSAFSNMETVHIAAYALLLETVGMPDSEFSAFMEYESMAAKHNYIQEFGTGTNEDIARSIAMFGGFTEGLQLFASFAMLMNFPRFNKMKGMGQIVTWSIRDESLHCEGMIQLYHAFAQETGCVTKAVADDIIDCCKTVVGLEDKFIDLAFEMGPVEGMTAADIKQYIRYIADWRLSQLDLPKVYGVEKHPLPWLTEILNGVEHANFFEARATEYSKAATRGEWHGQDGVWANFDQMMDKRKEAAV
jgi:ribonucleoside-diphosphate reductase beta chain